MQTSLFDAANLKRVDRRRLRAHGVGGNAGSVAGLVGCLDEGTPAAAGDEPTAKAHEGNRSFLGELTHFGDEFLFGMEGSGQGTWIHNDIVYWTNGADLQLADVSNPEEPQMLGIVEGIGARDVDVMGWAVRAGSGLGLHLIDVTDPDNSTVNFFPIPVTMDGIPVESGGRHWDARYWKDHVYHSGGDLVVAKLLA